MNTRFGVISKIDFVAASFLVALSLALASLAFSFGGVDFGVYYAAGRVFLQGGNPYDYSQIIGEIVSSTGKLNNPYYYAPWFTWAISPLALLPYEIARVFWAIINFVLWFWGLFNLSKLIVWPPIGFRRWGMYLFTTVVFAWTTWGSEQVGILIFLLLTFVLLSFESEKWLSMGIWMALLLFKPNITAFPLMVLSVWLISHRIWKPLINMAGMFILMIVVSLLISPGWYLELLLPDKIIGLSYTLSESGVAQVTRYTTTLMDWLATYRIVGVAAYTIYVVAVFRGMLFTIKAIYNSCSVVRLMALALLVNFALTPYALFYDYSPLVLTLFFVNFEFAEEPSLVWVQRAGNILVVSSLIVGNNIAYRYWIVVVLVCSLMIKNLYVAYKNITPNLKIS